MGNIHILAGYVPKKKKKRGKETTEETSNKSEEQERKDQGAILFTVEAKKVVLVISNYWCATNMYQRAGVVKEWVGSLAAQA